MTGSSVNVRFKAKLLRPASPKGATWTFVVLPASASAKLPSRSMTSVEGTVDGHAFQTTLQPDGQGSHWLKMPKALREAAGADVGGTVVFEIAPVEKEPAPKVPGDLREAMASNAAAKATWSEITQVARRDWIAWITSGKKAETRSKRIAVACDKLASGKRRACCFDRSGMYAGNFCPPVAAAD
ncbi:MAG: YdeI/OmpD-associated family protein [Luteimonas sp.]